MEMKYYNPSNHFKSPIKREPKPYFPPKQEEREVLIPKAVPVIKEEVMLENKNENASFFKDLDKDDFLILGLILLLILNACDDYLLLAALGYIFLSGKAGKA